MRKFISIHLQKTFPLLQEEHVRMLQQRQISGIMTRQCCCLSWRLTHALSAIIEDDPTMSRCSENISRSYLFITSIGYLFITNILMLNLLIAMFTNTCDRIQQNTKGDLDKWNKLKYNNIQEYYNKTVVAPPFTIFEFIYKIISFPFKPCRKRQKLDELTSISKSDLFKRPMKICAISDGITADPRNTSSLPNSEINQGGLLTWNYMNREFEESNSKKVTLDIVRTHLAVAAAQYIKTHPENNKKTADSLETSDLAGTNQINFIHRRIRKMDLILNKKISDINRKIEIIDSSISKSARQDKQTYAGDSVTDEMPGRPPIKESSLKDRRKRLKNVKTSKSV